MLDQATCRAAARVKRFVIKRTETTMESVPFAQVLDLLEAHGWELTRIWLPYRVFTRPGRSDLPILVEVDDGSVRSSDVAKIKNIIDQGGPPV